ncbi:hypothetical protein BDK92_7346 [Micromonospora pisi]|uniref:Uncharacterized protein n=1 Tax=Micromonospora pisi TaxID=589240 RepID=A0A495JX75_9ACTN|nr:hypothetical protein [Micromonospora pisi]RKR92864.1 hypothetical protein BDK92_7346 [Micromonospora pisi]
MTDTVQHTGLVVDLAADPQVHRGVHPVAQADCIICPSVPCPECGITGCPEAFEHRRAYAGREATLLREAA